MRAALMATVMVLFSPNAFAVDDWRIVETEQADARSDAVVDNGKFNDPFSKAYLSLQFRLMQAKASCESATQKYQREREWMCGRYHGLKSMMERLDQIAEPIRMKEQVQDEESSVRGAPCYEGSTSPRCKPD